ncbi:MAG TPA: protein-L-isoaspartate(D-aspartate) O-methyltransferase [Gammaproteobacteria bacterium]|nr:protein-L-isoaspartate(D-aspartate) O-methyltransferase [Gammaproteobacteria bacterium]
MPVHRLLILLFLLLFAPGAAAEDYASQRRQLIQAIEQEVRRTAEHLGQERLDPAVLDALGTVPRHEFVRPDYRGQAYRNRPLPIGYGQTISQPYIVAIMTDLLQTRPGDRVLEIGTGSGYQAAILAEMGVEVFTMEIVPALARQARQRLQRLGYDAVRTRHADGYHGWPEHAPFDAIVVTAAADHVPPPLLQQLKAGGRMIIPVGNPFAVQQLVLIEKQRGTVTSRQILPVRFVPLTRSHD